MFATKLGQLFGRVFTTKVSSLSLCISTRSSTSKRLGTLLGVAKVSGYPSMFDNVKTIRLEIKLIGNNIELKYSRKIKKEDYQSKHDQFAPSWGKTWPVPDQHDPYSTCCPDQHDRYARKPAADVLPPPTNTLVSDRVRSVNDCMLESHPGSWIGN